MRTLLAAALLLGAPDLRAQARRCLEFKPLEECRKICRTESGECEAFCKGGDCSPGNIVFKAPPGADVEPRVRVLDLDQGGKETWLKRSSDEFSRRYIDWNIVNAVARPDPQTMEVRTFDVLYADDNTRTFSLDEVPMRSEPPEGSGYRRAFLNVQPTYLRKDGWIYPESFNQYTVPNLVYVRTRLHWILLGRKQMLEMAELVNAFAFSIASLGGMASMVKHPPRFYKVRKPSPGQSTFDEGLVRHLEEPELQKKGKISGGHNLDGYGPLLSSGRVREVPGSRKPTKVPGVFNVEFQAAKLDGKGRPTGEFHPPQKKTVYDPKVVSTAEFLRMGIEAWSDAYDHWGEQVAPGKYVGSGDWQGRSGEGVLFEGHLRDGGVITFWPAESP